MPNALAQGMPGQPTRGDPRASAAATPGRGGADHPALLATKLFVPPPSQDLVSRTRVHRLLDAGRRRRLTLLSAPAGFGKTSALAAWVADLGARGTPVAWVSLDERDNDPVRFWSYVGAALDAAAPGIAEPAVALLRGPDVPPIDAALTLLANALAALDRDAVLVLDDCHAIVAPAVHDGLAFLLDHLTPRLNLVVAGRADPPLPLARLRARGDLHEVRAAELRFTPDEAAAFLAAEPGLALSPEDSDALAARTEGWIAALRLAALSLRDRPNPGSFVRAFAGSHRYLVDYLAEEVLDRQPADVRSFLLRTAVLDRLSGPLCDAVTGRLGGQEMLERLERANLFTVPLDDTRSWYRYHHLFADFLRARLLAAEPGRLPELHRRAAAWFEERGMLPEAVGHALAAADPGFAARLVEAAAEPMWRRGELTTLLGWLEALPPAAVAVRPRLALAHAGAHFLARSYEAVAVASLLDKAEAALRAASEGCHAQSEPWGILAAIRAAAATTAEDPPRAVGFARQALAALPEGARFWRLVATVSLGLGLEIGGDTAAADAALTAARLLGERSGHRYLEVVAIMNLARVHAAQGRLGHAEDLCHEGLALAAGHAGGALPVTGYLHVQLGKVAYERDDLTTAERHLLDGIGRVRAVDEQLRVLVEGHAALARVRFAAGDETGAEAMLRACDRAAGSSLLPWAALLAAAYRARLALRQGDLAAVDRWAAQAGLTPEDEPVYAREFAHLTLARLLVARGDAPAALRLLARLAAAAEAAGRRGSLIEILVVRALAHRAFGDQSASLAALERALTLGEAEGYARSFLDEGAPLAALLGESVAGGRRTGGDRAPSFSAYASRLLAAFGAARRDDAASAATPGSLLPDPLTPREREVLELIAAGLSNGEIADRLFVGIGTVKSHVNRIFAKLPAASRTQAVARARARGLLPR